MKVSLLLIGFCVLTQAANIENDSEVEATEEIARIEGILQAGEMVGAYDKEKWLKKGISIGSDRLLEFIVSVVHGNDHTPSEEALEILKEEDIDCFDDDPTIVATISFNLDDRKALESARKAARIFRQYGHRIHAKLSKPKSLNLTQDKLLLQELIEAGQLDINMEMVRFTNLGRFDVVKFLICHGADVRFWKSRYQKSSVLLEGISHPDKCDLDCIKFLVESGCSLEPVDETDSGPLPYAFSKRRFDVAKFLITKNAPHPNLAKDILRSEVFPLFVVALRNGYEFDLVDLKKAIKELILEFSFVTAAKLLKYDFSRYSRNELESFVQCIFRQLDYIIAADQIFDDEKEALRNLCENALHLAEHIEVNTSESCFITVKEYLQLE